MAQANIKPESQAAQTSRDGDVLQTRANLDARQVQVPRSREATPSADLKYTSPMSQPASITPPPSMQIQSQNHTVTRTPSPVALLNSPPPTTKQELPAATHVSSIPSHEHISNASVEELRSMLHDAAGSLREARTASAHYKLQYNMLVIDSNKARNEMEVELTMLQRELDLLQEAEDRRRATSTPLQSIEASNLATIHDLTRQLDVLALENEELRASLIQERRTVESQEVRIASLEEQNTNMRQRIRQNREHMNGILDNVLERSPASVLGTPSRHSYYGTPRKNLMSTPARQGERRDNLAFDALLLADKVLSQETATAPSTPKNMGRHGRPGHVRNTHSMSSLPATPHRRGAPTAQSLRTPLNLAAILEPVPQPTSAPQIALSESLQRRRRASSDTTITASDDDRPRGSAAAIQQQPPPQIHYGDVPESSASQVAASMLRATPKSGKKQAKITGKITKATSGHAGSTKSSSDHLVSSEKRRMTSGMPIEAVGPAGNDGSPKKRKVGGVGLGIGV